MRTLFVVFLSFFLLLSVSHKVIAEENFSTSYVVTYTVSESGITHAVMKGTITNNTSKVYATQYKVDVGFSEIYNVSATHPGGKIIPKVEKTDDGNRIDLKFSKYVAGKGKSQTFTLTFDTPNIARYLGTIWEISIPGIARPESFSAFTVNVIVPKSFGQPAYIKPETGNIVSNSITFTKKQLGRSAISMAYGTTQKYAFKLTYHIVNKNVFPARTEIALPPNTNYQEVLIKNINPRPENITKDADDNWLAQYNLRPTQKMDVVVEGEAVLSLTPKQEIVPEETLMRFTREKPYWQSEHPKIQKLASELRTPKAIYDYVVKTVRYDFSRVTKNLPRRGALAVIEDSSSAVCLEFTDLFIAIARAAGIPAREVDGFAYTDNTLERPVALLKDVLHAWPQYYDRDKQMWIMVDPTWSNTTGGVDYFTTLDLDHLAFVIRGEDSSYPVPAGWYKYPGTENTIDVAVSFANGKSGKGNASLQFSPRFSDTYVSWLPISGKIEVTNAGNIASPEKELIVESSVLSPDKQTIRVPSLPPFGTSFVAVRFAPNVFLTNEAAAFTMALGEQSLSHTVTIAAIKPEMLLIGGTTLGILTILVFITTRKARRLRVPR